MVAREKDGKDGYFVFAPFVTYNNTRGNSTRKSEYTIIVNLGWVPRNHKDRIVSDREILADETVEQDDSEDETVAMTKVTGVVCPTEKFNPLKGYVNWERAGYFKFIDLFLMARIFHIFNIDTASVAYLKRVVETYHLCNAARNKLTACPFRTPSTKFLRCMTTRCRRHWTASSRPS